MIFTPCWGVLVLVATAFGKIYFEENFDNDSWTERWITSRYNGTKFGKFERTSGAYYGNANNTGLRSAENKQFYAVSTCFTPFSTANTTLVLQFSVKFEHRTDCEAGYIKLYGCDLDPSKMHSGTPYFLLFGPWMCDLLGLSVNYLGGQSMKGEIELAYDELTHVYTLILQPNVSHQVLIDGKNVGKDGNYTFLKHKVFRYDVGMYPKLCGIGFNFYRYRNGPIFDNILVSDDVDVAKRKREYIFNETAAEKQMKASQDKTRAEKLRTGSLVDIESKDLMRIIDCNATTEFRKTERTKTFVHKFGKFLVPFIFNGSRNVIMAIAEYNQFCYTINENIQLWVSFQPKREDPLDGFKMVLDFTLLANSNAPGTVATIVINYVHYGFLQFDGNEHNFSVAIQSIRKAKRKLKYLLDPSPKLALQILDSNCEIIHELIKHLEPNIVDFLIFTPTPHEQQFRAQNPYDRSKALFPCITSLQLLNSTILPVLHSHLSIQIDFEEMLYKHDQQALNSMHNSGYKGLVLLRVDNANAKHDNREDASPNNFVNWLYRPTRFNKTHLGAVISGKDRELMGAKNLASTVFQSFQHIIIDISNSDSENSDLKLIQQEITNFNRLMRNQTSRNNTQLQTSIIVTIDTHNVQLIKQQADRIISAVAKGNEISPGTVPAIFFDWLACSRSEPCSGYKKNTLEDGCLKDITFVNDGLHYRDRFFNQMRENNGVSIGVVIDQQLMLNLVESERKCGDESLAMKRVAHFLWKITVRHEDIANYGAFRIFKFVVEDFTAFSTMAELESINTYFYVNTVGCIDYRSNLTLLIEYAVLIENLNNWAEAEGNILFINAGAEVPSKCNDIPEEQGCKCGWWIKQEPHGTYQDIKSVARQLYDDSMKISKVANDTDRESKTSTTDESTESLFWLWILFPTIGITLLIAIPAAFLVFRYRSKYILTKQEVDEFIKGCQATRSEHEAEGDETARALSYNSEKYELSPSAFTIDITSNCLGSGEFGQVYHGSIRKDGEVIETAAKIANTRVVGKTHGYYLALKGLLSEIKILAYVGEHNHIITLLGAYTKNLRKGEIAVFLELCQLGSLDKYLQSMKPQMVDDNEHADHARHSRPDSSSVDEEEECDGGKIQVLDKETSNVLFRWAGEITNGMEFLASKNLVHADLATRNILLTGEKVARICDFGLSRRLHDYTEYVKQNQGPLPWRWMAPESLCRLVFNEKTDIWSFGVTLWEMFTLGDQPYPGLSWNANFPVLLERGLSLPEPRYNVNEIYSVIQRCCNVNPTLRPTFSQLKEELNVVW